MADKRNYRRDVLLNSVKDALMHLPARAIRDPRAFWKTRMCSAALNMYTVL